jgi:cytochrome c oxidase subunit 2
LQCRDPEVDAREDDDPARPPCSADALTMTDGAEPPRTRALATLRHSCPPPAGTPPPLAGPDAAARIGLGPAALTLAACSGPQSSLEPAGRGAERIADLFWWMSAGAAVVWLAAIGLTVYATCRRSGPQSERRATYLIVGAGVVLPTVALGALLSLGLASLPAFLAPAREGSLRIEVTGEQWWWRVRYLPAAGGAVDLANEIRLPVGQPVEFRLESRDVIHSFWIPALGGKMDMIPGRTTRLSLEPTRTGVFRGACAEYCGTSHAFMSFAVVVEEQAAFDRWLASQRAAAHRPTSPLAIRGRDVFLDAGCGACHAVRGTEADGVVGPDLTHVGGRLSVGAGLLGNEARDFERWVGQTKALKPGVHMPSFGMLAAGDLRALAAYLEDLR